MIDALYEGLDDVMEDHKGHGIVLTCNDFDSAVNMVMHYGCHREATSRVFEAAIVKPSSKENIPHYISLGEWTIFYNNIYHRQTRSSNKIMSKLRGVSVTLGDIRKLGFRIGLNEKLINYFFALLATRDDEKNKRSCFFKKYDFKQLKDWAKEAPHGDIFNLDTIILPVQLGDHWACMCVKFETREIVYMDSAAIEGGKYKIHAEKIMGIVYRHVKAEWKKQREKNLEYLRS